MRMKRSERATWRGARYMYHNVGELSGPEDVSDRHHTKQKS